MPGILRTGAALLRAPATELGFALRSVVRWSRGPADLAGQALADPFAWADEPQRSRLLARRAYLLDAGFDLGALDAVPAPDQCRNLARLAQLQALAGSMQVPTGPDGVVRAADLGCGDFHYAPALQQWLSRHGRAPSARARPVVLRGLELDGHGLYLDGHSRVDHGRAWAALASVASSSVQYQVADAARSRLPEQDVVSLFFPFLTSYACLMWGAPLSRLRPRRLLERAVRSLRPGGWLVVANQTSGEHLRLIRLLAGLPVMRISRCSFETELVQDSAATGGQVGSLWVRHEDIPSGKISV